VSELYADIQQLEVAATKAGLHDLAEQCRKYLKHNRRKEAANK